MLWGVYAVVLRSVRREKFYSFDYNFTAVEALTTSRYYCKCLYGSLQTRIRTLELAFPANLLLLADLGKGYRLRASRREEGTITGVPFRKLPRR